MIGLGLLRHVSIQPRYVLSQRGLGWYARRKGNLTETINEASLRNNFPVMARNQHSSKYCLTNDEPRRETKHQEAPEHRHDTGAGQDPSGTCCRTRWAGWGGRGCGYAAGDVRGTRGIHLDGTLP